MMNYVGSVSIIDRGDAPAKAVIDKNTRSLAQRVADETKQELDKVMDRVDNIYVSYEMSTQTMFENPRGSPNVEYIEDIKELEEILTDTMKKKKYQQQVTVFIVGFQDISAQKMQLLQQVNQFFIENSKLDEEELGEDKPTIDLEEASTTVNESLNTAEELTKRLSDINQDMIDYLVNYANTKASNKGKKKLEKSLESAKNDVNSLSEKLLSLQAELEEKEDKFQQLVKQLETKTQEAVRYKTAAEVAKKSAQDNENHTSALQDEIQKRDEKIQELRSKLSRLEINLTESQFDTEMSKRRLDNTQAQAKQVEAKTQERMAKLQEEVETKKMAVGDAEREMAKMHKDQLAGLEKAHQEEIAELKQSHMEEIAKLTDELTQVSTMLTRAEKTAQEAFDEADDLRTQMIEIQLNQPEPVEEKSLSESPSGKSIGELSADDDHPVSKQESRPSTKDTKSSKKSESRPAIKTTAKSPNRGKEKGKGKDYAETGVQDEGGDPNRATVDKSNDPSRQPTRQSKNLEPVVEMGDQEFTDSFELDDEESWTNIPAGHVTGRFSQYRRLSLAKIKELDEQLNVTLTKTHRKVNSLKMQFSEHKNKWENERKILIEQVEQAQKLQTDAEKEADAAMTQLEEFINEQEKLEDEEETKRQEIIKTMSRPGTVKRSSPSTGDKKIERRTSVGEKKAESPSEERLQSENSEQELKNLMQQTDDAKAQEKNAHRQNGSVSAPPSVEPEEGQVLKKSTGRISTAERNRSSRTSKPSSAKSKTPPKSPQTPTPLSEPQNSSGAFNRQTSSISNRTFLTAPTPGTNVTDFERPPSKGSFQSVDNISVSLSTVPGGSSASDMQRPLSISSVKPVICTTPPPHLCKETQTDFSVPEVEHEPIVGDTEEEIRLSSARSRASLRNQFKNRLDETRHAAEERRTKTPIIPLPTQKSVDDELIINDEDIDEYDDDIDLPIPDDLKEEALHREDTLDAGTSPPPVPKHSKRSSLASRQTLSDHPLVHQYLRAYTGVHNFKEAMSRIMVDKDQMSASQILAELDMMPFDKDSKVIPQIETMTENIYYVLNELSQVINSVLQNDRGPVVSSLMMGMSRDTTQRNIREKSGYTADLHPPTRSSERSASTKAESMISDSKYKELTDQYEKLQNQMSTDAKRYEEQQRHNMVVMMEMQDTINQLQRELSTLEKQGRRPLSESASTAAGTQQQHDSAIMFTRLDSERNAKIMKKAVNEEKLDPNKYKEAVVQMDDYVNLPAQRLAHLVRKYVHHCRMKEIEENVQKSKSLNENVFEILDKMEALQNQRAKRWADRMDEMGTERMRLANMLMETLDGIEQESGIFLIKPMFSYRGRDSKDRFSAKTTRPLRPQRTLSPLRDSSSAYAPAPTPASNVRPFMRHSQGKGDTNMYSQSHDFVQSRFDHQGPLEGDNTGLLGSSVNYVGLQPKATWSMSDSQPRVEGHLGGTISNTPRILELDINRMMIGQNTISAHIGNQIPSNDRLVNASSNNLRSYMTVNRPTGPGSAGKSERPTSGSRGIDRSSSSPTAHSPSHKHVRLADIEVPTVIPNTQPLPPIGRTSVTPDRPNSSDVHTRRTPTRIPSGDDIPASPPGSSLRQSPPIENDVEVS